MTADDISRQHEKALVLFVLAIKLVLLLHIGLMHSVVQNEALNGFGSLLDIWRRWDTPHYLHIAANGYAAEGESRLLIVFFPLYPWLVRAMGWIVADHYIAALLISTFASLALALALYRLVAMDYGAEIAQRAVALLFIFPTSYFLHIAYTESLFLALVVGSILAARNGHWRAAGLLGMCAALTRVNGVLVAPVLAYEAWRQYRDGRLTLLGSWPIALVPIGVLIYLAINQFVFGDPLRFLEHQSGHWQKRLAPPWEGLRGAWSWMFRADRPIDRVMVGGAEFVFASLAIAATLGSIRRLRGGYTLWMALNTLLFLSTSFMQSVPRYCLSLFPMMILISMGLRAPMRWTTYVVVSVLLLALFGFQFSRQGWSF